MSIAQYHMLYIFIIKCTFHEEHERTFEKKLVYWNSNGKNSKNLLDICICKRSYLVFFHSQLSCRVISERRNLRPSKGTSCGYILKIVMKTSSLNQTIF